MNGTHLALLRNIVKRTCDSLDKYLDYPKKQAVEISKNHETAVVPESKTEDFTIIKLNYHSHDNSTWEDRFLNLKNILSDTNFYVLVEINMHALKDSGHRDVHHANETLIKKAFLIGFPKVASIPSSYYHRVHTKFFISFGSSPKTKTVHPNK